MDPLKIESKGKGCESVHFYPSFSNMCITIMAFSFSMLGCCVSGVESVFLLGDKQEAKFRGVMSA